MVSIMFFLGCLVSVEIYGEWHSEKRALGETSMQECHIHRESKKQDTKLLAITSPTIIRFSKFCH